MFLGLCIDVPVQRELSLCLDSVSDQSFLGGLNMIKHLRPRRSLGGPWAKTSVKHQVSSYSSSHSSIRERQKKAQRMVCKPNGIVAVA